MNISAEAVTLVLSLITIGGVLWKAFSVIADLRSEIAAQRKDFNHFKELYDQRHQMMKDWATASINQTLERVDHVTGRSRARENELDIRLSSVEGYLQKNTSFEIRTGSTTGGI